MKIKHIGRYLAVVALSCFALFALAGCSQVNDLASRVNICMDKEVDYTASPAVTSGATITEGVLTVGINAQNSPYGGTNASNETVGLDVDIAAALADELGLKLQIVDVNSNGKSALSGRLVDVTLGATKSGSITTVSYSSAYIDDGTALFALKSNAGKSVAESDFTGAQVLALPDSDGARKITETLGDKAVITCNTLQEGFSSLENGAARYLVCDAVVGNYFARSYSDIVCVGFLDSASVRPVYAATLTSNAELTAAVNKALTTVQTNGIESVIVKKWLGSNGEELLPARVSALSLPEAFDK